MPFQTASQKVAKFALLILIYSLKLRSFIKCLLLIWSRFFVNFMCDSSFLTFSKKSPFRLLHEFQLPEKLMKFKLINIFANRRCCFVQKSLRSSIGFLVFEILYFKVWLSVVGRLPLRKCEYLRNKAENKKSHTTYFSQGINLAPREVQSQSIKTRLT